MTDQVDRTVLPIRRPPFAGVANRALGGSQPDWGLIGHVKPPAGAPNVRSLLSLLSYLGSGEYRERYLGVKIPPTNLQEHHLEEARKSADGLASRLLVSTGEPR
jgi:hypothetical protein